MATRSDRVVASILVIGLLSVALSLVCTDGVHLPFFGTLDGKCARMAHTDPTPATVGSASSQTLVSQLVVLGSDPALFAPSAPSRSRTTLVDALPNPPPDPLNGRLRI